MASTLVVEDGTGLADASSYTSAADLRAYALARGITLAPSDAAGDALVDQMAIKAMDYIEANRASFWGWRLRPAQRLSFPREGVPAEDMGYTGDTVINGYENLLVPSIAYRDPAPLPYELADAQSALTMQVAAGVNLQPTQISGQFVTRQKLGPIEKSFSEAIGIYTLPQMPMVDALLSPLLKARGPTLAFRR